MKESARKRITPEFSAAKSEENLDMMPVPTEKSFTASSSSLNYTLISFKMLSMSSSSFA